MSIYSPKPSSFVPSSTGSPPAGQATAENLDGSRKSFLTRLLAVTRQPVSAGSASRETPAGDNYETAISRSRLHELLEAPGQSLPDLKLPR
jgi:hypothetical protein